MVSRRSSCPTGEGLMIPLYYNKGWVYFRGWTYFQEATVHIIYNVYVGMSNRNENLITETALRNDYGFGYECTKQHYWKWHHIHAIAFKAAWWVRQTLAVKGAVYHVLEVIPCSDVSSFERLTCFFNCRCWIWNWQTKNLSRESISVVNVMKD